MCVGIIKVPSHDPQEIGPKRKQNIDAVMKHDFVLHCHLCQFADDEVIPSLQVFILGCVQHCLSLDLCHFDLKIVIQLLTSDKVSKGFKNVICAWFVGPLVSVRLYHNDSGLPNFSAHLCHSPGSVVPCPMTCANDFTFILQFLEGSFKCPPQNLVLPRGLFCDLSCSHVRVVF